ncbi:MAG TPA: ABC transporter permease, partial [Acidimicrobiales bacterium]|nr:ABC transporter permease [Acidimicrobiales bacterium]
MTELFQFTLFGLMLGCVYAIASMGLVLTYTVTGVFNFAHGAVGMVAAFAYFELRVTNDVPTPIALVLIVFVLAPLTGLLAEGLLRRFQGASYATSLVVTIALTVGLLGFAQKVFPDDEARFVPFLFGDRRFTVFDVPITYDRIAQVVIALLVAFGLRFLLFRTPLGARMRAVVDDPELAQLNGVRSVLIARCSWMIGFSLAALGGVLFAAGTNVNAIVLTLLVLNAYGAAMVGRLTSLPMTFVGALLLGLVQELTNVTWLWPDGDLFSRVRLAIPGLFLVLALLFVPSFRLSAGRVVGRDQPAVPSLRGSLLAGGAFVAVVWALANLGPDQLAAHVIQALVIGTIALSLVAVTGLSGQISLAQYLFLGIGAYVAGDTFGGDSVLGMLLGGVVAAALGVVVALPSARLRGLHLALSTFGFALIGREAVLADPRIFGLGGLEVSRPEVLGISTTSDAAFAVWCAVVFSALAVLVGAVRRSWFGRQLTAIRDSELAAATLGLRVRWSKVAIFAFSAFIAGCAGSLFGGMSNTVDQAQFEPVLSLVILLFAFVGGITTVTGAVIAGSLFALLSYAQGELPDLAGLVFVAVAAGAIGLGRQPD